MASIMRSSGEKAYFCSICLAAFGSRETYRAHLKEHSAKGETRGQF